MLLTKREAALALGICETTLDKMRKAKGTAGLPEGPPFLMLGCRAVRYPRAGIEAWIADQVAANQQARKKIGRPRKVEGRAAA
ncbi:helix-turn-helix transcriptional regulator [Gluconacetobacter diazotrophicus]|uniref:helix-turn-helix transcriptional regulator n=1 Tax=Gluconacetobacter diazotrophicus TaxID=33996 RepID=UPI001604E2E5|nr:hypothetical protein [Gluconacetobacter diazotrophicus]